MKGFRVNFFTVGMIMFMFLAVLVVYMNGGIGSVGDNGVSYSELVSSPDEYKGAEVERTGEVVSLISRENECAVYIKTVLGKEESLSMSAEYTRNKNNQVEALMVVKADPDVYDVFEVGDPVKIHGEFDRVFKHNGLDTPVIKNGTIEMSY